MASTARISSAPAGSPALAQQLGALLSASAAAAVTARGAFVLAVSGGSLPGALAAALRAARAAGLPLRTDLWRVLYVDERLARFDDADSNHGAMSRAVYTHDDLWREPAAGAAAAAVLPIDEALVGDGEACAAEYEARVRAACGGSSSSGGGGGGGLRGDGRGAEGAAAAAAAAADPVVVDLALLGLGPDGHTASLFPGHALLRERVRLVAAISDSPKPPRGRVTMTLPLLAAARELAFVAYGGAKREMLARVLAEAAAAAEPGAGEEGSLPAALVARGAAGRVVWMLDDDALPGLSQGL